MKNIIIVGAVVIIALLVSGSVAFGATYGKQFPRGELFGVIEGTTQTAVYKLADPANNTVCYVAQFGKSGVAVDCVK